MSTRDLTDAVRRRAFELGFDACRVTSAEPPESAAQFRAALVEGRHAEMHWLARHADKRTDPQRVLPDARSIVVLAASYFGDHAPCPVPTGTGVVARYARFKDYHDVLTPRLQALAEYLDERGKASTRSLYYTDTGPILERDFGQRAGLGFIGKHTGLISRELGNWFLLGEVLTTVPLDPDPAERNHCGSCTRCLTACPTQALPAPFTLDARRCISYLTIEHRGSIPEELRPLIGNRIFGCDDCLAVCPWNRFARAGALLRSHARQELAFPDLIALLELDESQFRSRFYGTPLWRTKRRGLLRNVCIALGNQGDATAVPALRRASMDPEPLIAEHALWALQRLGALA